MSDPPDQFQLDDLQVDVGQQRVRRGGEHLPLPKLSFAILVALAKAAPKLVSIDELMSEVWPGLVVNSETVGQRIKLLRDALGDDPRSPRYIESVRGRGYRLLPPVVTAEAPNRVSSLGAAAAPIPIPPWWIRHRVTLALILGCMAIATLLAIRALWPRSPIPAPAPGKIGAAVVVLPPRTVAVLPIAIIGNDPKAALLASGIAESIRLRLGALPQIVVIADTSSATFSGGKINAPTVGRELNARYLLEGTLQQQADSLRITARLVDAQENQDVWSVLFDRKVADIFSVQDEISTKIARALNVTVDAGDEQRRLASSGTNNLDAYLEYLEGRGLLIKNNPADSYAAVEHLRRATELDANYSAAYSALAYALLNTEYDATLSDAQRKSLDAEARKVNAKALALDPRNAVGYVILLKLEPDNAKRVMYLNRILALEPNSAFAHAQYAQLADKTDADTPPSYFDDRISHLSKAMEIDPLNPYYPTLLAQEYFYHRTGEIDSVEPLLLRSLELDPNYGPAREVQALLRMSFQRRVADGIKITEHLVADEPIIASYRDMLAFAYASMGDIAAADDVVAGSVNKFSRVITLSARHQWHEAVLNAIPPNYPTYFDRVEYSFALRMDAHKSGEYAAARKYFENTADIKWDKNGLPVIGIPMGSQMTQEVALADILQKSGEVQRARRILEASLNVIETAATKWKRGDVPLRVPRLQALALLGRDTEALDTLEQIAPGANGYEDWRHFEVDPIFNRIRHAPQFVAFLEQSERYDSAQRALVQKMRDTGEIAQRPTPKSQ